LHTNMWLFCTLHSKFHINHHVCDFLQIAQVFIIINQIKKLFVQALTFIFSSLETSLQAHKIKNCCFNFHDIKFHPRDQKNYFELPWLFCS
jgi:hypothetical protein